jgi:hypothetical protein
VAVRDFTAVSNVNVGIGARLAVRIVIGFQVPSGILLRTGHGVSGFQASRSTGIIIRFQQVQIEGVNLGHRRISVECGAQIVVSALPRLRCAHAERLRSGRTAIAGIAESRGK